MENDQLVQAIGLKSAPTFILVRERKEPFGDSGSATIQHISGIYIAVGKTIRIPK